MTLEQYQEMLFKQNGLCLICGKSNKSTKRKFPIDHDHKTGKVRGIICHNCNRGLHYFDDKEIYVKILAYLEAHAHLS